MTCLHDLEYTARASAPVYGVNCERPNRWVCRNCGEVVYGICYSLDCEPCAELKRGDLKAVFRSGASVSPVDRLFFTTLTAPGETPTAGGFALRWDRSMCAHSPDVKCSGDLGCRVVKSDSDAWNAGLPKRWSYFRQFMERELPGCTVQVVGVWEWQQRGALHRHCLVRVTGVCTEASYRRALRAYRDAHDFGNRYDVQVIDAADDRAVAIVAGYLGKYCVKSYGDLGDVACGYSVVPTLQGHLVRRRRLRGWSASRTWGDTLQVCRARRTGYWAQLVNHGAGPGAGDSSPSGFAPGGEAALDPYSEHSTDAPIPVAVGVKETDAVTA